MLISPAFAQGAAAPPGGGLEMFFPFILIIVIFYFLLWRPQQKKMKMHRSMLEGLKRGDRIVTGGGIYGRIARIEGDDDLIVEIAPEVRIRVVRSTVSEAIVKGEPAKASAKDSGKGGDKGGDKGRDKGGNKGGDKGKIPTVERK